MNVTNGLYILSWSDRWAKGMHKWLAGFGGVIISCRTKHKWSRLIWKMSWTLKVAFPFVVQNKRTDIDSAYGDSDSPFLLTVFIYFMLWIIRSLPRGEKFATSSQSRCSECHMLTVSEPFLMDNSNSLGKLLMIICGLRHYGHLK